MKAYLTNQTFPFNLNDQQKRRFAIKATKTTIKYDKVVSKDDGRVYVDDKIPTLSAEFKNILSGRDKFYFYMKQKYCNITEKDCADFLKRSSTFTVHKVPPKQKVFRTIISSEKNERWQCDFIQLPPVRRFNYCFTLIDHNTKKAWVFPVFSRAHQTLISKIKDLFLQNKPKILQCDNEFKSKEFDDLCKLSGTKMINSSSYKPNSNGCIERFNKTYKELLHRLMTENKSKDWVEHAPKALDIYNSTYHSTIKNTPDHHWNNNIKHEMKNDAKDPPKFKVGDHVKRVKDEIKKEGVLCKSYRQRYTDAVYKIMSISSGNIAVYTLMNIYTKQTLKFSYKMGNVSSDINSSIKDGINVISGPNGLFSVVRNTTDGVVSAYKHTVTGLQRVYQGTERDFFRTANNVFQNVSNIAFDAEKGIVRDFRAVKKDIITLLDDVQDNLNENFRQLLHKIFDTAQWVISLGFLGFLLVLIMFGDKIFGMIEHFVKNGVKITF